jgi:hypothetical protein
MKKLERLFAVFEGNKLDRIPFFADVNWWYSQHRSKGTLPYEFKNMDLLGVAKTCGFIAELGGGFYRQKNTAENIEVISKSEYVQDGFGNTKEGWRTTITKTPLGKIERLDVSTSSSNLTKEFPVKTVSDIHVMKYLLDHTSIEPAFEGFSESQKKAGDDGLVLAYTPHSPLNTILFDLMGQYNGLIALNRHKREVEDLMLSIERIQDQIYRFAEKVPSKIIKFGEHVHADINNPKIFKKYQIPYFRKRVKKLHNCKKICICHWDGYFRKLLPFIRETGFDAIEGVTPKPSGDVTLAELRKSLEGTDIALWGGIPASIFQEPYTDKYFKKYVKDTLKTIAPGERFVMALGDNLGPTGLIHRVKIINKILKEYQYPITEIHTNK